MEYWSQKWHCFTIFSISFQATILISWFGDGSVEFPNVHCGPSAGSPVGGDVEHNDSAAIYVRSSNF